jgi:Rrf2 family protein
LLTKLLNYRIISTTSGEWREMQLSTRGRYAVRAMVDLALHAEGGPVSRAEIARRQGISPDYIAQLFLRLQRAGLVRGIRGPGGGYVLGRDAAEIRVGDIVRTVEGPMALVGCVESGGEVACSRAGGCVTRRLWQRVSEAISETLNGVTLADLCVEAHELHWGGENG